MPPVDFWMKKIMYEVGYEHNTREYETSSQRFERERNRLLERQRRRQRSYDN